MCKVEGRVHNATEKILSQNVVAKKYIIMEEVIMAERVDMNPSSSCFKGVGTKPWTL